MAAESPRERISINDDWRFARGDPPDMTANLTLLQVRQGGRRGGGAATRPVNESLWPYILASGNDFTNDPAKKVARPAGNPAEGISYASASFADASWRQLDLPHDFGIEGPFLAPGQSGSDGGTGRLPFFGQVWYANTCPSRPPMPEANLPRHGCAMAYAIVFVNGQLVGGWPYGYASWRADRRGMSSPARTTPSPSASITPQLVVLVSRRRHLPQRVAHENRARSCVAVGNLYHHGRRVRGCRHRQSESQRGQSLEAGCRGFCGYADLPGRQGAARARAVAALRPNAQVPPASPHRSKTKPR